MALSRGQRLAWVGPGLLLGLAALAFHGLVLWDPRSHGLSALVGWFFETSESSPQLVFAIVAGLLLRRRAELRELCGEASPGLAALCLVPAVAIHLWAQWVDATDLMVVSLGLAALGVGFLFGGRPLARVLAPPLAILVFAIPLPGALHNAVVYPYQLTTASIAEAVLRAAGFDVAVHGDVIDIARRQFEVIETCSGLRSAQTLLMLAGAWAAWFRCPWWHTLCLLAAAPLIAFVTNGIRVLVLVIDPSPAIHESHATQGFVMFIVGIVALGLVDRPLLRFGTRLAGARRGTALAHGAVAHGRGRVVGAGLALGAMAVATLWLPALRPAAPERPAPPELPRELAGWTVREGPDPGLFLGNVWFTQRSNLSYERGEETVAAFLGWDDHQLRIRSLLSDKNAVPGLGWAVEERGPVEVVPGTGPMQRVVARRFASRSLALHAYRGTTSVLEESLRAAFALDRPGSPFARSDRAGVLRVSTPIGPGPEGLRDAEERLRSLLAELAPHLDW
jgi:exosortase